MAFDVVETNASTQRVAALSRQVLDRTKPKANDNTFDKDYFDRGIADLEDFLAVKASEESLVLV